MRTALVTGGNRGIGLEICRQLAERGHRVILSAREAEAAELAVRELAAHDLIPAVLDVSSAMSIRACAKDLDAQSLEVDVLVNNAGVFAEGSLLEGEAGPLHQAMEVNALGAYSVCHQFVPAMLRRGWGRVVNLSSGYASFSRGLSGPPAYAISKAALNALTVCLAAEVGPAVKVNAADPGWVQTRMGGEEAPSTPAQGADTAVWLATLDDDGPSGGLFHRRTRVDW